ncbi:Putative metal-sulfur cluster biosynthesis proteins YuaD [Thalassovita gelatinovora]|uniref:Putative metal-sulfur cluster biosynthesis proteins YuaD n=1 Tax=Thalassovita gelatinovora TaxID=53501 RepID=A0A0P1F865_THAGE|nr:MOSC domain-containing protein [Thalassovita gelatinovora]QIZ80330.1 MOSC domain-containing protein [Thalassovita gelatinovora]CUH64247.1 Putative metal-sulfur cluster biosynthesis proteins YuaD [Thalassovita gelatinovora]SEQ94430.1 MOSC domain-containing protein [Thalassovita gelatinovora]
MPALKPTNFTARITWLGYVPDRDHSLRAEPLKRADLTWAGIAGEAHGGVTRRSCSRVIAQYPRGTQIRNVRQLSVLSAEELAKIAETIGADDFDPRWVGASMVIEGIPDFTHVPPSSRLQAPSGASLVIDMENRPCHLPAPVICEDLPEAGKRFKQAAAGKRGVTAWVEREGAVQLGDILTLHIPDQPTWTHLDKARG